MVLIRSRRFSPLIIAMQEIVRLHFECCHPVVPLASTNSSVPVCSLSLWPQADTVPLRSDDRQPFPVDGLELRSAGNGLQGANLSRAL
jgi:hypothetical protein